LDFGLDRPKAINPTPNRPRLLTSAEVGFDPVKGRAESDPVVPEEVSAAATVVVVLTEVEAVVAAATVVVVSW
jgi:hypothetical protein